MGVLSGWPYRKAITLARPSGQVTNYQFPFRVGYNGVAAANTTVYPSNASSESSAPYDDKSWSTPYQVRADDNVYANATSLNGYMYLLQATEFSAKIPQGSKIIGIKVELQGYSNAAGAKDVLVRIAKDSTPAGDNKATNTQFGTSLEDRSYGGATDTWGQTWTPDEINSPYFSVFFSAQNVGRNAAIYIDYIRVVVYYEYAIDLEGYGLTDFGDVRFTTDDGATELPYYIQDKIDSDYAMFWVNCSTIGTTDTTIYIYYGRQAATTTSDGANTFIDFDDFERGNNGDAIGGSWTVVAGTGTITTSLQDNGTRACEISSGGKISRPLVFSVNNRIELAIRKTDAAIQYLYHGNGTYHMYFGWTSSEVYNRYYPSANTLYSSLSYAAWHNISVFNFTVAGKCDMDIDLQHHEAALAFAMNSSANYDDVFYVYSNGGISYIDHYLVRQFQFVTPSLTGVGARENLMTRSRIIWGYNREPDSKEIIKEWTEWRTSGDAAIPTEGGSDFGTMCVSTHSVYLSSVIDTEMNGGHCLRINLNVFASSQGGDPIISIRGSDTIFTQFAESPEWEVYSANMKRIWKYVQIKVSGA